MSWSELVSSHYSLPTQFLSLYLQWYAYFPFNLQPVHLQQMCHVVEERILVRVGVESVSPRTVVRVEEVEHPEGFDAVPLAIAPLFLTRETASEPKHRILAHIYNQSINMAHPKTKGVRMCNCSSNCVCPSL